MIICEYEFVMPDPKNPKYSFAELDFYAWIPAKFRELEENHRLTLRKNLETGNYEVVKHFHRTDKELIVSESKDLQDALDKVNELWKLYHSSWAKTKRELDKVCKHEAPQKASTCEIWKRKVKELKGSEEINE